MQLRTDRVGILIDQLTSSCDFAKQRLDDLTDDEFLWEAAIGAWSIRRRESARTTSAFGAGEWVLDFETPEPNPAPMTTIAWRVGHLLSGIVGRYEWTFGSRTREPKLLVQFRPSASEMLVELWRSIDRWGSAVETLNDEQLERPGFGQYPYGLDPELPFIAIVWWTNREIIHHLAEAALLRDLYAAERT